MLRSFDNGPKSRCKSRCALVLVAALWLPACSVSMPVLGSSDAPTTTGSIRTAVQVQKPVPDTLAYSDASKIGQAAAAALWQANYTAGTDWTNAATGSSGTVEKSATDVDAAEATSDCRSFQTFVTSIGGVHSYKGKICRGDRGSSVVHYQP